MKRKAVREKWTGSEFGMNSERSNCNCLFLTIHHAKLKWGISCTVVRAILYFALVAISEKSFRPDPVLCPYFKSSTQLPMAVVFGRVLISTEDLNFVVVSGYFGSFSVV